MKDYQIGDIACDIEHGDCEIIMKDAFGNYEARTLSKPEKYFNTTYEKLVDTKSQIIRQILREI